MNLRRVWLIARREYLYNFRRRSYLFTAFVMPLIVAGAMAIVFSVLTQAMESTSGFKAVGIVDKAGIMADQAGAPVIQLPSLFRLEASEEQAASDLKNGSIDGYYVLPADFVKSGHIDVYNRQANPLSQGVHNELDTLIKQALADRLGSPVLAERLQDPLQNLTIYKAGTNEKVEESALISLFMVPTIFSLLIFMSIITTSQFLMSGMVDEKENRMMELFVTSTSPGEMLWGKLLGLGALGLTQILVWAAFGVAYAGSRGINLGQALNSLQLTPGLIAMMLVYFVLGYFLFGSVMAGVGASVNAEQEGRQLSSILSMVAVVPFFFIVNYMTDPNGTIPRILSLVPFTAPVGMILRAFWASVPPAEILVSVIISALTVLLMIWIAARIFRLGMLNYGKRLSIRDIVRAFREGRRTIVTASEPKGASL